MILVSRKDLINIRFYHTYEASLFLSFGNTSVTIVGMVWYEILYDTSNW